MGYLDGLNPKQVEAVTSNEQYLRVIAGAGSGKTRVLTHRIAYLIDEIGIPDNTILAITFTNKAAGEMKNRVESLLSNRGIRTTIKTFHSFCVRVLREDGGFIGYNHNFEIVDDDDQKKLIKDLIKELNFDKDTFNPGEYKSYIGYCKSNNISVSAAYKLAEHIPYVEMKVKLYEAYQNYLIKHNYLDFDDLLIKTVELYNKCPEVKEKWQRRFTNILVDEFQDTNDIQYELIKDLCAPTTSLFVVGDPDQTIYTWRGANMDIIMHFKHDFKDVKDVVLDVNYRSTKAILNCANILISNNKNRVPKDLITDNEDGEHIIYYKAESTSEEAYWVAGRIQDLILKGVSYSDIAILYRSNYYSASIEKQLVTSHIPYAIYGGLKFFQRKEVKDALCYLRLIVNSNDDIAFKRVINEPKRGIGDKTFDDISAAATANNISLYEAYKQSDIKNRHSILVEQFYNAIDKAKGDLASNQISFAEIMQNLLESVSYLKDLQDKKEDERIDNINNLKNYFFELQQQNPDRSLIEMLQETALFSDQDEVKGGQTVSLMTIHTAKGLEFNYVFLIGMSDGVLPNSRALAENGIEEERRLAYVAITRAQKKLYLTSGNSYSFENGGGFRGESIFLNEIEGCYDNFYNRVKKRVTPIQYKNEKRYDIPIDFGDEDVNWRPGSQLIHTVYGEGIVISMDEDTLTVAFKDNKIGQKIISKTFKGIKMKGG